ncbi:MAG: RNA chaperone Hfq [Firmicutes bacterium]|nr:RNA chaperone Hfq [Bacillota bacterium]
MKQSPSLQDFYLNQVMKEKVPVVIYLVNGVQLRGVVSGFDNFTVLFETDGKSELIYKHAVSTISPQSNMNIGWQARSQPEI